MPAFHREVHQEGRQEGELNRARAIALKLLRQGMSVEQISLLTELSSEDVRALSEQDSKS
ncbi:hypothetical protein [Synechococcus sp. PCC 7336]|uniref:hypothetical protein n=1 Tax=Synechococcus sp. PCC 7336 TaxID=195250 RepID=UPI00036669DF|nr:hypothetical protein [Synechococcus sp. PCC 7336]